MTRKQHTSRDGSAGSGAENTFTIMHSERHTLLQWQTQMLACGIWLTRSFRPHSGTLASHADTIDLISSAAMAFVWKIPSGKFTCTAPCTGPVAMLIQAMLQIHAASLQHVAHVSCTSLCYCHACSAIREQEELEAMTRFLKRSSKLHHLLSTSAVPGIYRSPYQALTNTVPLLDKTPLEDQIRARRKNMVCLMILCHCNLPFVLAVCLCVTLTCVCKLLVTFLVSMCCMSLPGLPVSKISEAQQACGDQ